MCIAAWSWQRRADYPLVVVANRDEFHERPAADLARWEDGSGIIAGRDGKSGGTWLGIGENTNRFALITNFRDPFGFRPDAPSRGALVSDWLDGSWESPGDRQPKIAGYNGFSLLMIDGANGWIACNRELVSPMRIPEGVHGLSNGPFSQPWPKTRRLMAALADQLETAAPDEEALFALLTMDGAGRDADSEDAPIFMHNPVYGTRCSTVVVIDRSGNGWIAERRFDASGTRSGETRIEFRFAG